MRLRPPALPLFVLLFLLFLLPRRKMARSVAACSIFKRRCNLPTIPNAAECRGWVLDRHIYLTESKEGGGESQEGWSGEDEAHAMRQKLRRQSRSTNDATAGGFDPHYPPHIYSRWIKVSTERLLLYKRWRRDEETNSHQVRDEAQSERR